jgi:hypothetical protein
MTVALAQFIKNNPYIMAGAVLGLLIGELVPLHQSVAEWTRQTIWNNMRRMVLLSPEMTTWENMIFKAKNVLAGGGFGSLMEIASVNILKILYGLAHESKKIYHIPDPNEMQNLLMLTGHALQLAVKAQRYDRLSDEQKEAFPARTSSNPGPMAGSQGPATLSHRSSEGESSHLPLPLLRG